MRLIKPVPYTFDPGRILTPEEKATVAKSVTPIHLVQSRTCKREDTNDRWRLGRR
jgi:hypothetical protein